MSLNIRPDIAELEERVDFPPDAIAGPDGLADDLPAVCADYERAITDAGGVDGLRITRPGRADPTDLPPSVFREPHLRGRHGA